MTVMQEDSNIGGMEGAMTKMFEADENFSKEVYINLIQL